MTLITATLAGAETLTHRAKTAKRLGADLIELRIDTLPEDILNNPDTLRQLIKNIKKAAGLPIISTIRCKQEQILQRNVIPECLNREQSNINTRTIKLEETKRLDIFKLVIPLSDYIDIELSARDINREVVRLAHTSKKQVIVSYHNFNFTPPTLALRKISESSLKLGADIVKIACMAKTADDTARLLEWARAFKILKKKPIAALSMGKWSGIARLAGFLFGSHLIYSYIGKPTAPGQPSLQQLMALLRSLSSLSPLRPKTKN